MFSQMTSCSLHRSARRPDARRGRASLCTQRHLPLVYGLIEPACAETTAASSTGAGGGWSRESSVPQSSAWRSQEGNRWRVSCHLGASSWALLLMQQGNNPELLQRKMKFFLDLFYGFGPTCMLSSAKHRREMRVLLGEVCNLNSRCPTDVHCIMLTASSQPCDPEGSGGDGCYESCSGRSCPTLDSRQMLASVNPRGQWVHGHSGWGLKGRQMRCSHMTPLCALSEETGVFVTLILQACLP